MPFEWSCPHCEFVTVAGTKPDVIKRIRAHFLQEGGNILVYEDPDRGDDHTACMRHLSQYDGAETGVLVVTREPAAKLEGWHQIVGEWPAQFRILTPNMGDRVPAADIVSGEDFASGRLAVDELAADDLKSVATTIDAAVNDLAATHEQVTVCMDNLSRLVDSFGTQSVFKMVHALTARIRNAGAVCHWHFVPAAHIESTRNIVPQPFELVHDVRGDANSISRL